MWSALAKRPMESYAWAVSFALVEEPPRVRNTSLFHRLRDPCVCDQHPCRGPVCHMDGGRTAQSCGRADAEGGRHCLPCVHGTHEALRCVTGVRARARTAGRRWAQTVSTSRRIVGGDPRMTLHNTPRGSWRDTGVNGTRGPETSRGTAYSIGAKEVRHG